MVAGTGQPTTAGHRSRGGSCAWTSATMSCTEYKVWSRDTSTSACGTPAPRPDHAERASHALKEHLRQHAPWNAEVVVTPDHLSQPHLINASGPAFDAFRRACTDTWGRPPVEAGSGGSLPLVAALTETYPDMAMLLTGVDDPESKAHAENESVHLGELQKCCVNEALLLGTSPRRSASASDALLTGRGEHLVRRCQQPFRCDRSCAGRSCPGGACRRRSRGSRLAAASCRVQRCSLRRQTAEPERRTRAPR